MSYTQQLIASLETHLTSKEFNKVSTLIKAHAKQWGEQKEAEQKQADAHAINFGKYKGRTAEDTFAEDPEYIKWLTTTDLGKRNPRLLQTCLSLVYQN